ncbi:hypothetical protein BZG36_02183 [Bifiguratus adelaidae]|uniref:CN hydrolase domain-containing protein n=1 Tax=Bifiguratus adelaidae TaxID=1938954 RepID=A0A261Y0Q2_9FUNG|nr:hypothetical protein BZG36_02183 [Bifiguratus adelaidae]
MSRALEDQLILFPECALTGYADDVSYIEKIDPKDIQVALARLHEAAYQYQVHIIFGTYLWDEPEKTWRNAAVYLGPSDQHQRSAYYKVNLANSERPFLKPGEELNVFKVDFRKRSVTIGIPNLS